jgi:hypothetical protein
MSSVAALIYNASKSWLTPVVQTINVAGAATILGNISNSSNAGTSTFNNATFAGILQVTSSSTSPLILNQASNQLQIIPGGGIGTKKYTFSAAAAPIADVALSIYDPGQACALQMGVLKQKAITGVTSLTAADSGALINVTQGAYAITLPAVATSNGVYYKFVLGTAAAATCTIIGAAGTPLNGTVSQPTGGVVASAAKLTFTFVSGVAVIGDYAEFYCNGALWSVHAFSGANGGATIA